MAKPQDKPTRKLSDFYKPQTNDDILASIDGVNVEVASAVVRTQQGERGDYLMTTVSLLDGRVFNVAGKRIGEAFAQVPPEAMPIVCRFEARASAYDAEGVYWVVS